MFKAIVVVIDIHHYQKSVNWERIDMDLIFIRCSENLIRPIFSRIRHTITWVSLWNMNIKALSPEIFLCKFPVTEERDLLCRNIVCVSRRTHHSFETWVDFCWLCSVTVQKIAIVISELQILVTTVGIQNLLCATAGRSFRAE